jgi:AraC-like DNA-binding protein
MVRPKHVGNMWNSPSAVRPRVLAVTRSICEAGYYGRYESAQWILDYSFTSFGRYRVGAESAPWKKRLSSEAHLYSPRTPYWEDTAAAGVPRTRGIFLSFAGGETALASSLLRSRCVCFRDPAQRLGRLLERMLELGLARGPAGFAEAQAILWEIIGLLNTSVADRCGGRVIPAKEEGPMVSGFIQSVHAYLHEHLAERVTRESLARHLKLSVSVLAHRYHDEAGESLMNTLARMRIHAAKGLLLKGYSLKLIAAQTGFCDEYHLSRTFKRTEGIPAREFRRRQGRCARTARLVQNA